MPDLAETTKEHEDSNVVEEETIQPQPTKVDTPPPPPPSDPILRKILEAISRLEVTNSADDASSTVMDDFPPLFTDDGGLKRRAMREEQEEARLLMEQESRIDSRQAPEPQEEEEPESGSLQLGGELQDSTTSVVPVHSCLYNEPRMMPVCLPGKASRKILQASEIWGALMVDR